MANNPINIPMTVASDTATYSMSVAASAEVIPMTSAVSIGVGGDMTDDVKQALLQLATNIAYINGNGQIYYADLYSALYNVTLSSISAVYTQGGTVYTTDSLDSLKTDLVVTATYSDSSTATIDAANYTLSGTLTAGTSTITVTYGGKTTTFTVTVTQAQATLSSISCVYTQGGTVYTTDTLDSLKTDLVVTAHYSDSTTETVASADYTLSGTLTAGTSTITVTYEEKTATFTVTVSQRIPAGYTEYGYILKNNSANAIITGLTLSSDYIIELSFGYNSTNGNATNIMGTRVGSNKKEFGLFITSSTGKLGYWYDGTDSLTNMTGAQGSNAKNTIKILPKGQSENYPNYATITLNGTEYSTGNSSSSVTWSSWLGLGAYATSASATGGTNYNIGLRIGEIIVKDTSNNIIYDLIPVHNGSAYGFYESINGTFYSPNGGTWSAGNW